MVLKKYESVKFSETWYKRSFDPTFVQKIFLVPVKTSLYYYFFTDTYAYLLHFIELPIWSGFDSKYVASGITILVELL